MAALKDKKIARLRTALDDSYTDLSTFRELRLISLEEYVGAHYAHSAIRGRAPVNLIELATDIYLQNLVSSRPNALVTTVNRQYRPAAKELELALNYLMDKMDFHTELRRCVMNAIFCMGIMKVGKALDGFVTVDGEEIPMGTPYAMSVDFDDWVHDTGAKTWDDCGFMGHRYRMSLSEAKKNKRFSQTARSKLESTQRSGWLGEGSSRRAESLSHGDANEYNEFSEQLEIWEIWTREDNRLISFPADNNSLVLFDEAYEGPEHGPFNRLGFKEVPNNVMPLPPVANWLDLHQLANKIYIKLGDQAINQKTITGYQGDAADDAERVREAMDMHLVQMNNPAGLQQLRFNGIDQSNFAFGIHVRDTFSFQAGNLETLGGLGAAADTARQESMMAASSSRRMQSMQGSVVKFTTEILRDIAVCLWGDEQMELPLVKRVESQSGRNDIEIPFDYTANRREGEFIDYNIKIEPFSLTQKTPQEKAMHMVQTLNMLQPHLQFMQQQGLGINYEGFLRRYAKYMDMEPEFDSMIRTGGIPFGEEAGVIGETSRTPKPTSVTPEPSDPPPQLGGNQKNDQMISALLSGGGQQGQPPIPKAPGG